MQSRSYTIQLSVAIRRSLSPPPHRLSAQWGKPPCSAEPRIELGPYSKPTCYQLSHAEPHRFTYWICRHNFRKRCFFVGKYGNYLFFCFMKVQISICGWKPLRSSTLNLTLNISKRFVIEINGLLWIQSAVFTSCISGGGKMDWWRPKKSSEFQSINPWNLVW